MDNRKEVCFWTQASSLYEEAFQNMKNSLKKFHPDIPLIRFTDSDTAKFEIEHPPFNRRKMNQYAYYNYKAGLQYKRVIHIDSDVLVCSYLKEVFEGEYDVATILDDDEFKKRYSLGFFVSIDSTFNEQYLLENDLYYQLYNDGEQGVFNNLLSKNIYKYKIKRLDDGEGVYSTSICYSMKEIKVINNSLYFRNKPIRIIHVAAHWGSKVKMLNFTGEVTDDVLEVIKNLEKI